MRWPPFTFVMTIRATAGRKPGAIDKVQAYEDNAMKASVQTNAREAACQQNHAMSACDQLS